MQFAGFTEADFDAYLPARATSNAFNRPRVEVKQKALAVARRLHELATDAGVALEVRASEEVPSLWNKRSVTAQWVFFWRDQEARKKLESVLDKGRTLAATITDPTPYFRHAFLALFLDSERVEVTLKVHGDAWVDVRNLRARLDDDAARDALVAALRGLPGDVQMGVTGGGLIAARDADGALLSDTLESLHDSAQWWFVARSLPRAEAAAKGAELGPWVEEAFRALLPVYRLVAWSHDNDLVSIDGEVEAARAERLANLDDDAAREAEWRRRQDDEIERRRETAVAETRERVAGLERPRPAAVHAATQNLVTEPSPPQRPSGAPARGSAAPPARASATPRAMPDEPRRSESRRPERREEPRAAQEPRVAQEPKAPQEPRAPKPRAPKTAVEVAAALVAGARVKVRTGPFVDRVGTIAEVDARGHARVMFGLIAARLDTSELVTVTEA